MAKEQSVAPRERVNITYKPATGGAQAEVELPLKILIISGMIVLAAGFTFLYGLIVMLLWNWLMPDIFSLPRIDYWHAWGGGAAFPHSLQVMGWQALGTEAPHGPWPVRTRLRRWGERARAHERGVTRLEPGEPHGGWELATPPYMAGCIWFRNSATVTCI